MIHKNRYTSYHVVSLNTLIDEPISGEWGVEGKGCFVLRTTNFRNDGSIDYSDVVTRAVEPSVLLRKKLVRGDVIIEKSGGGPTQPVGRVVYFDIDSPVPYLCNNFTAIIRSNPEVDPKYLFWCLFAGHRNKRTLKYQNKTTGIINLQMKRYLSDFKVPLPPLQVQKEIAQLLDTADALRHKDTELLKHYNELAQAIFYDMFGEPVKNEKEWEKLKARQVIHNIVSGWSAKSEGRPRQAGELGVLKVSAVTSGVFRQEENKVVKSSDIMKKLVHPLKGDVLMTRANTRELVAACCIVDKDYSDLFLSDKHWKIVLNPNRMIAPYFKYIVSTSSIRSLLTSKSTGTSGSMYNIKQEALMDLVIPVPPLETQVRFSAQLDIIEKSRYNQGMTVNRSEALFNGLLQEYMS